MSRLIVGLSPFFGGEDWTDELTGITFTKSDKFAKLYAIPEGTDLTNIRKAIRLNTLFLVEGDLGEDTEVVEPVKAEEPAPVEEPVKEEEPSVEVVVETKEEPKEEAKPKPRARRTKK